MGPSRGRAAETVSGPGCGGHHSSLSGVALGPDDLVRMVLIRASPALSFPYSCSKITIVSLYTLLHALPP